MSKINDADKILALDEAFQKACAERWKTRFDMSAEEWIENHASGTLRKNKRLGMSWKAQYLEERVAFEYGFGFEAIAANRITTGQPITSGDCSASTETGWHTDRYQTLDIFGDKATPAYIQVEYGDSTRTEGTGMVLDISKRPSWLPESYVVFAIIGEYDPKQHHFLPPRNPF